MNKPLDAASIPPDASSSADRRLTLKVLLFASVAYVIAPFILVCLYASTNFYTRMEQWYAMNMSLQSIDPTRIAIDDPKADLEILKSLVSPKLRDKGFVEKLHERWRADKLWAIREGDLESFSIDDTTAHVVILFRTDMATAEGTHFRDVRETTRWEKIDGTWYLADLKDELAEERFTRWPGVIVPW